MKIKTSIRKFLLLILTIAATLSVGFLSFVGMYAIFPQLLLCGAAFGLAAAFEGQVNKEGIGAALKRMFDPDRLKVRIVRHYLDDLVAQEKKLKKSALVAEFRFANNKFYQDYRQQKKYIKSLEKYIEDLKARKSSFLRGFESVERDKLQREIDLQQAEYKKAKKRLQNLQIFFSKKLHHPSKNPNEIEKAVANLLGGGKAGALKKEIKRKALAIKLSWLLDIGIGASSGFATLSAMQTGIAMFSVLSFIPGGFLLGLAIAAGLGYALLIYQNISDMIQDYKKSWISYFNKREKESRAGQVLRCSVAIVGVVLALAVTFATAGTWYKLVKDGAKIAGFIDKVASTLRDVFLISMVLPSVIFNTKNSVESVDKLSKVKYREFLAKKWSEVVCAWNTENIVRFINPFRAIEKTISFLGFSLLFKSHSVSIGVGASQVEAGFIPSMPTISPVLVASVGACNETLTDANYLNKKNSILLAAMYGVLILPPVLILKTLAVGWDYVFSSPRSLSVSFKKMFTSHRDEKIKNLTRPEKPALSEEWNKQEVIEVCDNTIDRLKTKNPLHKLINNKNATHAKINAVKNIRENVISGRVLRDEVDSRDVKVLAANRHLFWKVKKPESQVALENAFDNYFDRPVVAGRVGG